MHIIISICISMVKWNIVIVIVITKWTEICWFAFCIYDRIWGGKLQWPGHAHITVQYYIMYFYTVLWSVLNGISIPRSLVEIPFLALLLEWIMYWTLLFCYMTHYVITTGNTIARGGHCDIIMGHDIVRGRIARYYNTYWCC